MRQIKFRAKRLDNGQWVTGDLLTHHPHHGTAILEHGCINYAVDPETVSQYTGKDDDLGNEIYEGDIVDNDLEKPSLVKWYVLDDQQGYWLNLDNSLKVVGNKWDNPDMTYDEFIDKYNPKL